MAKGRRVALAPGDLKSAFTEEHGPSQNTAKDADKLWDSSASSSTHLIKGLERYTWFYPPRAATLSWGGEARMTTMIRSGLPQSSLLSPVIFLIGVAKVSNMQI